jgi:hypothetical protein
VTFSGTPSTIWVSTSINTWRLPCKSAQKHYFPPTLCSLNYFCHKINQKQVMSHTNMCVGRYNSFLTQPNYQVFQIFRRLAYALGRHTHTHIYIYIYIYIYIWTKLHEQFMAYVQPVSCGLSNRDQVIFVDFYFGLNVLHKNIITFL